MTSMNVKATNWKQFFLSSKELNFPSNVLKKIKEAGATGIQAEKIFTDFSRNPGIALTYLRLMMVPTQTQKMTIMTMIEHQ